MIKRARARRRVSARRKREREERERRGGIRWLEVASSTMATFRRERRPLFEARIPEKGPVGPPYY